MDYIGNKTSHVPLGLPLSPAIYIPGVQNAAGTGCPGLVLTGPGGKPAAAAGTLCSSTSNQAQRFYLTMQNPAQGNQYLGGGGGSVLVGDEGTGNYHGLVTTVQHRLSSNFSLLANWTWSKCLNEEDAQGDLASTTVENPNNPALDYAPCGQDYRHIENIVLVSHSKFGISNSIVKTIVNGWEVATLAHILSGAPFTVTAGVDNSFTDIGNDRPNIIPGVPIYTHAPLRALSGAANRNYLNPLAFCSQPTATNQCAAYAVAPGTYGNAGRNAFRGLPNYQFDGQISRIIPIHERLNATLRLECFNLLNHPDFAVPPSSATALSSSSFGQVSTIATGSNSRLFQGSIKFEF